MEKKIIGYVKAETKEELEEIVMKLLEESGILEDDNEFKEVLYQQKIKGDE